MSPTVPGHSPHTRASSINGGGPSYVSDNINLNGMAGTNGGNRVFAHLDDLVAVRPDVDINSPIRKILQDGELLAKQADTHLDFRRPDIALQEYIKASIVAIEIIPRHKEYVMVQSGKGELNRMYAGLNKRINAQHSKFAEVKILIKENNAKSGVKPTGSTGAAAAPRSNGVNGHTRAQSVQHTPLNSVLNGTRQKPPIQPKPDGLHGNAISSDLAARFASLRSGGFVGAPVQDPRIRTQNIPGSGDSTSTVKPNYTSISRPTGPREMPSVPTNTPGTSKPALDLNIPAFPRAPDAIYSPSQNADIPAAANLLSSVPRSGSYAGTSRAAPPISTHVPTPKIQDERKDYFIPAHSRQPSINPEKKSVPIPVIPDSTTVSAEDLMTYLSYGSQTFKVLLVDVRSREDFEIGHILAGSIICVEPITIKAGISAEQLGDSMIINPDSEQALYENRDEFDLIVFYDQSSRSLMSNASGGDATLLHFSKAVYEYDYEKRLKRRPMLLLGGLDAWTDLLGPNSLKASISRTSSPAPDSLSTKKHGRPIGRFPPARHPPAIPLKRRKTHSSRPLTKEEEAVWDQTLRADSDLWKTAEAERASTAELVYAKTTEDFFRRYPELPAIQESMVSPLPPAPVPNRIAHSMSHQPPPPPARPAPALPRQRSSGLSERGPTQVAAHTNTITEATVPYGLTGLSNNSMVTCYMNAAIQAISATPFLRELLLHFDRSEHRIPRKSGELTDPPQLLVRSFNILMSHLWSGQYNFLTPHSFGKYVNSVHAGAINNDRVRACAYGGNRRQHDSAEFFNFLIEILDDELNPSRTIPLVDIDDPKYEAAILNPSIQEAASYAWNAHVPIASSPISHKMRGMVGTDTRCPKCGELSRSFQTFTYLLLNLPEHQNSRTLTQLIEDEYCRSSIADGYKCPGAGCNAHGVAVRQSYLYYVPDYLVIQLNRYNSVLQKKSNTISFPENGLNISSACVSANKISPTADRRMRGPFIYDTYAVTMHHGSAITSGHYFTYARSLDKAVPPSGSDGAGKWHKFNDANVTPAYFAETQGSSSNGDATIIFLKRQGSKD